MSPHFGALELVRIRWSVPAKRAISGVYQEVDDFVFTMSPIVSKSGMFCGPGVLGGMIHWHIVGSYGICCKCMGDSSLSWKSWNSGMACVHKNSNKGCLSRNCSSGTRDVVEE